VVERPRGGHRFFKTQHLVNGWNLVKMETGRGHYGKRETADWKGRGVGMWQAGTFKIVAHVCVG
jgi:hypothetical protein